MEWCGWRCTYAPAFFLLKVYYRRRMKLPLLANLSFPLGGGKSWGIARTNWGTFWMATQKEEGRYFGCHFLPSLASLEWGKKKKKREMLFFMRKVRGRDEWWWKLRPILLLLLLSFSPFYYLPLSLLVADATSRLPNVFHTWLLHYCTWQGDLGEEESRNLSFFSLSHFYKKNSGALQLTWYT